MEIILIIKAFAGTPMTVLYIAPTAQGVGGMFPMQAMPLSVRVCYNLIWTRTIMKILMAN